MSSNDNNSLPLSSNPDNTLKLATRKSYAQPIPIMICDEENKEIKIAPRMKDPKVHPSSSIDIKINLDFNVNNFV